MKRYFPDPREIREGTQISAEGVRGISSFVLSRIVSDGSISISRTGNNLLLRARPFHVQKGSGVVRLAKFIGLNEDGNTMQVKFSMGLDQNEEFIWAEEETEIYKPWEFQSDLWDGKNTIDAAGREIFYSTNELDKRFQRKAFFGQGQEEIQEISGLYKVDPPDFLDVFVSVTGYAMDMNTAGRHWAAEEELEEE